MAAHETLNKNWLFYYGDEPGADFMGYDDRAWRRVTLPHDWAPSFCFSRAHSSGTGYLPGGVGWYRKHFYLPEDIAGKRVTLTFLGVYKHARVWINSNYLGGRAYGYSTFSFDVSPFVRPGENVLAVRVEHAETADSRWYTGSGIYRSVLLSVGEPACFSENGVFVSTAALRPGGAADLRVQWETAGCDGARFTVLDACGNAVAAAEARGAAGSVPVRLENALLWSPERPYLYSLRCEALSGGRVTDTETLPFGVREVRFTPDRGMFLNGENYIMKGVCVHHDAGCLGAAVPENVWARRLLKLKNMGCNALRTAHNPPDPALLGLCDRLGFLVMDEAFDEWEGAKNKWWQGHNVYPPKRFGYAEDFPFWHEADLRGMILRDRCHPSVILWSIGNEVDYPNDPYVTPLFHEALGNNDGGKPAAERVYDARKPDASRLAAVSKELVAVARAADGTRPVLSALSFPELSTRTGFADTLDVWGYNYRENLYDMHHAQFPDRVIFGSENGHDPAGWQAVLDRPFIAGQFLWTGIDFLGECRGWPERISGAGALDLAGFEKAVFYQRKALWSAEPFVKLAVSPGETERAGMWTDRFVYEGDPCKTYTAACYTNLPEAELFLNGRSLGRKTLLHGRAAWTFQGEPGELTVRAGCLSDTLCSGVPAEKILLSAVEFSLPADGESVAQIEVTLTDRSGRTAAAADTEIRYQVWGDGEILGIENGRPDDLTPYAAPYRKTYFGRAVVYVRAGTAPGPLTLCAFAENGLFAAVPLQEEGANG